MISTVEYNLGIYTTVSDHSLKEIF